MTTLKVTLNFKNFRTTEAEETLNVEAAFGCGKSKTIIKTV